MKQEETLEEELKKKIANNLLEMYEKGFAEGAKWQQEQDKKLYSEEDLKEAFAMGRTNATIKDFNTKFKKK
jgi:hypothetical protein